MILLLLSIFVIIICILVAIKGNQEAKLEAIEPVIIVPEKVEPPVEEIRGFQKGNYNMIAGRPSNRPMVRGNQYSNPLVIDEDVIEVESVIISDILDSPLVVAADTPITIQPVLIYDEPSVITEEILIDDTPVIEYPTELFLEPLVQEYEAPVVIEDYVPVDSEPVYNDTSIHDSNFSDSGSYVNTSSNYNNDSHSVDTSSYNDTSSSDNSSYDSGSSYDSSSDSSSYSSD